MKLHTNTLRASDVRDALAAEIKAGRIASHVGFKILEERGSRSHEIGIEVQLEAFERDNGRRAGNSGSYGAMRPEYDGYAATYDEWGWLINALYEIEAERISGRGYTLEPSVWGTVKYAVYKNREDFDKKTGMTYNYKKLLPLLQDGYWPSFDGHEDHDAGDPYPFVSGRQNKSRKGAGRISRDEAESRMSRGWTYLLKHDPRYPLSYAQWAHVEPVAVSA